MEIYYKGNSLACNWRNYLFFKSFGTGVEKSTATMKLSVKELEMYVIHKMCSMLGFMNLQ